MCPVLHFAALAFADHAFHDDLMSAGLTPHCLHSFSCPDGRITIEFALRDDILEVPVFRRSMRTVEGHSVHPTRAESADTISYGTKRLGQRAGFEHPFTPYCLRREVGTEITGV